MHKFSFKKAMILAAVATLLVAEPAMAETAGEVADRLTGQFEGFAKLIFGAMFLVGIGLGGLAALKFKAHADNPQQNKLTTPIILALVAAMLIALPTFINTGLETLWSGAETGGIQGDGAGLIGQ